MIGDVFQNPAALLAGGAQIVDHGYGGRVGDQGEDLVRDVSFQAAQSFSFGLAPGLFLRDVFLGAFVAASAC